MDKVSTTASQNACVGLESMRTVETECHVAEVIPMDTPDGKTQAVRSLEEHGVIIADFGSTFGVVFQFEQRRRVQALRKEDPNGPLARSSLFAPTEVVQSMWPHGLDPILYSDAIQRMTNIGFIRFLFNPRAYAFNHADSAFLEALRKYCLNDQDEVQVFPMLKHPLADAWAQAHPDKPALAVRSANEEKQQEQAVLFGAEALANSMGLHEVFVLSTERLAQAKRDQATQLRNGLSMDERGFAKGNYATDPEMEQRRWGSVPIVKLVRDPAGFLIERLGNLDEETLVFILVTIQRARNHID